RGVKGAPFNMARNFQRIWIVRSGGNWWCDEPFAAIPTRTVLLKLIQMMQPSVHTNYQLDQQDFGGEARALPKPKKRLKPVPACRNRSPAPLPAKLRNPSAVADQN